MKIRTDFVTNSSSSSFIVAFENEPESWDEIQHMMFFNESKNECMSSVRHPYNDDWMSSEEIAKIVFNDIEHISNNGYHGGYVYNEETGKYETSDNVDVWDRIRSELNEYIYLRSYYKSDNNPFYNPSISDLENQILTYEEIPYSVDYLFKEETGQDRYNIYRDELVSDTIEKYKKIIEQLEVQYEQERSKIVNKMIDQLKEKYPNSYFAVLSYADENGPIGSLMEHGEIFYNLPHITIYHH